MSSSNAPGPDSERSTTWAPLPTMSLLVGIVMTAFALVAALAPALVASLLRDQVFARVLGVTLAMAGVMLARVSIRAALGVRRFIGVAIALSLLATGAVLLAVPSMAVWFHDNKRTIFVPWVFGIPAVASLLLSRYRVV